MLLANHALGGPTPEVKEVTLGLDSTALRAVHCRDRDFLILRQPRCVYPDDPVGAPVVPARLVRIVVPWDAKFQSVTVTNCKTQKLAGKFDLNYVREECPPGARPPATQPDKEVYEGDKAFPAERVQFLRTGLLRGYKVFFFRVNPIQYLPKAKELLFHSEITLRIEYAIGEEPDSTVRPRTESPEFRNMLARCVENPDDIESPTSSSGNAGVAWGGGPLASGGPAHYLIICADTYKDEFQPLADWKKQKGVPSKIVTVESIETDYTGADTQEKIKNCIIDHVNNNGTVYVLLGGDIDTVPHRQAYLKAYWYTDNTSPCDLYYAGLDDVDWDDDDDNMHGELEVDGDTIDIDPDVFVGRYSCSSVAEVQGYVAKVIEYERQSAASNFGSEVLLTGVRTWDLFGGLSDVHTWSLRMYDDCIAPYQPLDKIEYFDTTDGLNLTAAALKSEIDNGHNIVNMMTHGEAIGWYMEDGGVYGASEAGSQTNDCEGSLVYTIACNTNWFDLDCMSETITRNAGGGAVGYIGCSRYGWGDPGSYLGGRSIILNRTFYVKLLGENLYHLGEVCAAHKWEHAGESLAYNPYRWIQLGINLLGDPELPVWTDNPQTMSAVYPQEIAPGSQTIYIRAEPGAYVCLWKDVAGTDEVYVHGAADTKGGYSAIIDPATTGTLKLTVTKQNCYPFEADITVTDTPALYVATAVLPDGEAGKAYQATLEAGGGTQPYSWSVPGSLPDGLVLNGAIIEGTPTSVGSWMFTVQVEDSSFDTATAEFTVDVSLDVPDLQGFASPDYDGNYTAAWTGSDAPTHYELQESTTFTDHIIDDAESGTGLWDISGFSISSARSHSPSQSFYGGNTIDSDYTMAYAEPVLVGGSSQISFWCWYDIENGTSTRNDFAFFEVSLNDGATWLRARTYCGTSSGWVQETVDLSPYAGRSIRLRFRYYTSHQDIREGFYVDDIDISGITVYDWTTLSSSILEKYYDITGRSLGTYYYRVRAFDGANPSDWSEVKSVTVEEPVLDLLDGGVHTIGTTTVYAGQSFSMGLDVERTGGGPATAHKTAFYLSTDDTITTADYPVGEYFSSGFTAASQTQSFSAAFPGTVPEGTYYAGCIIDCDDDLGETDETNNTVLFAEQVSVVVKYTLTVSCRGRGSAAVVPDQPLYDPGDIVEMTAVPDTGWKFDCWQGDLLSNANPATAAMSSNMFVEAVFVEERYSLTVNITGEGTVSASPYQSGYRYGEVVTLTPEPEKGYVFSGWSGDLAGRDNPATITMDADKTVEARFTRRIIFTSKDSGGCSCAVAGSHDPDLAPRAAAGCLLPLLAAVLCMFLLRRRRSA